MSENNQGSTPERGLFDVLAMLPEQIDTPQDKVARIIIQSNGGQEFPVRVYRSDGEEFEGHCFSLADLA